MTLKDLRVYRIYAHLSNIFTGLFLHYVDFFLKWLHIREVLVLSIRLYELSTTFDSYLIVFVQDDHIFSRQI